jgi:hypothetical protein
MGHGVQLIVHNGGKGGRLGHVGRFRGAPGPLFGVPRGAMPFH